MDILYLPMGLSISNVILGLLSIGWLFYRLRKVIETPIDDLVRLIGLEVPVAPVATLIDISSTSVIIQWKIPDLRSSATKYIVKVNGLHVGEVSSHENAINIVNLKPGHFYIIRIVAANSAHFQASSELVRVRTSEECLRNDAETTDHFKSGEDVSPAIISYKPSFEAQFVNVTAPVMAREHSGSVSNPKRSNAYRRPSPVILGELGTSHLDSLVRQDESTETIPGLATKLEIIRKDVEESEKQDEDDDKQFEMMHVSLIERREQLRQQLKERDDESNELKKNVMSLERQNTAAQTRKSKQEKLLLQRKSERERFCEEISRWERDTVDIRQDLDKMVLEKEQMLLSSQHQLQLARQEQDVDVQAMKALEERLMEARRDIKELEEEQQALDEEPNEAVLFERQRRAKQEDMEWSERLNSLQARHQSAWNACNQAQHSFTQFQRQLDYIGTRHNNQATHFATQFTDTQAMISAENTSTATPSIGMRNNAIGQDHNRMPSATSRPMTSALSFQTPSPFFNSANPITAPTRTLLEEAITDADAELLTGGALASPSAGVLLPSGLLGDDSEEPQSGVTTYNIPYLPGLGADPGPESPEGVDDLKGEAASSLSLDSRSPSAISSPHGSTSNFHQYKLSETRIDSDRRSIRSTSSSTRAAPSRRFVDLFGLQRNRATSNEGLPLGSLRQFESRSLPRQEGNITDVSSRASGAGKRGGGSSGLFGSMSQAFNRMGTASTKVTEEAEEGSSATNPDRGAHFGLFGSRGNNIWATRTNSSRPASTYSLENALPRTLGDTQSFGWPGNDPLEQHGAVSHGAISYPWSSIAFRRQSVQPKIDETPTSLARINSNDQEFPLVETSPPQAPIGTRPRKLKSHSPPKQLNPAATDFRSMLGKDRKADRSKIVESSPDSEDEISAMLNTSSSSQPRKSKEERFSSAAESMDEVSEDQAVGSPAKSSEGAKESFMRKMTRKGSGKFSLSNSLKEKSGSLFSRRGGSLEDPDDDNASSAPARSMDSVGSSPQALGDKRGLLASFKRRKKGTDTPSISEASMASETGDEGDDRPSVDFDEA